MISKINSSNQQCFCGAIRDNGLYKEYLSRLPKKDLAEHNKLIKKITDMNDGRDFFVSKYSTRSGNTTYKYYALNEQVADKIINIGRQLFSKISGDTVIENNAHLKNLFAKPFKYLKAN